MVLYFLLFFVLFYFLFRFFWDYYYYCLSFVFFYLGDISFKSYTAENPRLNKGDVWCDLTLFLF